MARYGTFCIPEQHGIEMQDNELEVQDITGNTGWKF